MDCPLIFIRTMLIAIALLGCDEEDPIPSDGGMGSDSGVADTGLRDGGLVDVGLTDAGLTEAGLADTAPTDVGQADTSVPIRLSASGALELRFLGDEHAREDEVFSIVRVQVNNDQTRPISIQPRSFSVLLNTGIQLTASAQTSALAEACPSNGMLAAGRSTECELAFLIGTDVTEDTIILADEDLETLAETPYPTREVYECGEGYLYFDEGTPTCGECPEEGTCDGRRVVANSTLSVFYSDGITQSCDSACAMIGLRCVPVSFPITAPSCIIGGEAERIPCEQEPLQNSCEGHLCGCE